MMNHKVGVPTNQITVSVVAFRGVLVDSQRLRAAYRNLALHRCHLSIAVISSCIYKKVDEDDADGKEKAYKSFQILAKYLEEKGITGIIYPCTRTNRIKGKNVVLFDIHDAVPIIGSITQYHYNGAV